MNSPSDHGDRPLVALTVGDPAGIGPEIALAAARDDGVQARMRLVVIGPARLRPSEIPRITRTELEPQTAVASSRTDRAPAAERTVPLTAERTASLPSERAASLPVERAVSLPVVRSVPRRADVSPLPNRMWLEIPGEEHWELGRAQASSGRAALAALRAGHELALAGCVAALVTGPVSKTAMHLAGERVEGQTELLGRWSNVQRFEMMAVAGELRVMLLTRHMPLRRAIEAITPERVLDRLQLFDESLRRFVCARPKLALAGLNPHAGEGGLLGSEEDDLLRPAVERARAAGIDVAGPISPDSVFEQGARGVFDGVLALYHDQAFIPIKLLSRDGGITVIAGLPYLRISPVHGTAFEIAGRGLASPAPLIGALLRAAEWSQRSRVEG
jgi:4-hydroxythreonine-4-phosphate dehydrogenase